MNDPPPITQTDTHYLLWKNRDYRPIDQFPFKGIAVEFGISPTNQVKIRRLLYPKDAYSAEDVEKINEKLQTCPWCHEGRSLSIAPYQNPSYKIKLDKYLLTHNPKIDITQYLPKKKGEDMTEISLSSWLDPLTKNRNANIAWAANIISGLTGIPIDLVLNELWARVAKGIIGITGGAVINFVPRMPLTERQKLELNIFFSQMVAAAIDPSPIQLNELTKNFEQLKTAFRFGRAEDWWKSFGNPLEAISNAAKELAKAFMIPTGSIMQRPASFAGQQLLESGQVVFQAGSSAPAVQTGSKLGYTYR